MKSIDLRDFAREIGKHTEESINEVKGAVARGLAGSMPILVAASPVDTGLYAASWDFTIDEEKAIIGNYAPYAGIIEYGARPFKPPIGPLLAWAKRVLKSGSQPPDYEPEVWRLAIGVQKKIMEEGMAPKHVMENAIPKILANVKQEMERLG